MRLIDLDKLLLQVKMRRYTKASLSLLYNQEVVEAIPIEFLRKWFGNNYNALTDLLEAWRKENELLKNGKERKKVNKNERIE